MTETSPRQPDPPSENPLSPAVTTSQTPLTTAQSSSDAKPSTDMSSIDPCIMEQDQSVVLEEHTGGGFDPNGHYRNGKFHCFWLVVASFVFIICCSYLPLSLHSYFKIAISLAALWGCHSIALSYFALPKFLLNHYHLIISETLLLPLLFHLHFPGMINMDIIAIFLSSMEQPTLC